MLGSSVQSPEGHREAPSAEHCPAQLTPWPQVATLGMLSGAQQVTSVMPLEKVKVSSKKSTDEETLTVLVMSPKIHSSIFAQSLKILNNSI